MQGVQFLTNAKGKKIAVMIDLKKHGELWEDFYDRATVIKRAKEPRETLESVKRRLRKVGKISG
ncbi:MAG: hypothetical protein V2A74_07510 [bacterium]